MDDTISRQAAIDELTKDKKELERIISGMGGHEKEFDHFVGQRNQVDCDISAIEQLPSAHRWIPVTERLPEKYVSPEKYVGEWLCCTDDGVIMILLYGTPEDESKESVFYLWNEYGYYYETYNVVAWMPLPKPYERSEE